MSLAVAEKFPAPDNNSAAVLPGTLPILLTTVIMSLKIKFLPLKFQETKELYLLSRKLDISIYDCSFVLLAIKLKASLYTADKKLFIKAKDSVEIVLV